MHVGAAPRQTSQVEEKAPNLSVPKTMGIHRKRRSTTTPGILESFLSCQFLKKRIAITAVGSGSPFLVD